MKKTGLFFILLFTCTSLFSKVMIVEGKYQNKNLYIQNGFSGSGVGFCTYEVAINGFIATDEIQSSSFEIDFSQYQIKYGQSVKVEIYYRDDCAPRVLNPEVLKPKATFEITSISVSPEGLLKWTAVKEAGDLPYIIEQFKWNKWIKVGEVHGIGTPEEHTYTFKATMHSGENKFRVKQIGYGSLPKYSKTTGVISNEQQLTFTSSKSSKEIMFSGSTLFEVYDVYGRIVRKGYGKNVNVESLNKGVYFLCYDNSVAEFKKR